MWAETLRRNSRCNLLSVSVDKKDWAHQARNHARTIVAKYSSAEMLSDVQLKQFSKLRV